MAVQTPQSHPIVVCRDVVKKFPQGRATVRALQGVDLSVRPGELMLIAGPSGCGKTTLISVIAGILEQTSGSVSIKGTAMDQLSRHERTAFRGQHIGFVFQQFNLLPSLTAAENASIPLIVAGRSRHAAVTAAGAMLEQLGLGERLQSLPTQLSGGEQQRVAIARALIHEPQLIVCDEPTSALDAKTGQAIMELLRRVAVHSDRAVIVVTHDPRVMPFGDRVALMEDGRVVRVDGDRERSGILLQQEGES